MKVLQYISDLLLEHDCVIVPGFGAFIANHIPASIQPVIHSFVPPHKEILFNSGLKHNDGLLASYISRKEKISYDEAWAVISNFVFECNRQLKENRKLEFPRVGTIIPDQYDFPQFSQDTEHNFLLSSYGLTSFISPAIQREGIEKRIEKVFSENRTIRSERKSSGVWAKVAIISVPAAAIFVWAFVNIGTFRDVADNYTNLTSIFSGKSNDLTHIVKPEKKTYFDTPRVYDNPLDINNSKTIFEAENKIIYPCFTNPPVIVVSETSQETTDIQVVAAPCQFYIIGSCNRNKDLAENYKSKLIGKGYQNANILEPKDGGLYKVYIDCFDTEEAAAASLKSILQSENSNAWLLKM